MLLLACMCYTTTFAQKITADKVPAAVSTAFKTKFAQADKVSWEMEDGNYEVSFTNGGKKQSAIFDKSGRWLETETGIAASALPKAVSDGIAKQFAGYAIKDVAQLETPDKGSIYEVELAKDKEHLDVQLSSKGEVLNKEVDKD